MDSKIFSKINQQINLEAHSAYVYLHMAAYFDQLSLSGCAKWLKLQAQEELSHMMKFFDYLISQNQDVLFEQIEKPSKTWDTPLSAFNVALAHEKKVTASIHDILDLAISLKDHRTVQFLQWFVEEQIEEEQEVQSIVDKIKLIRKESTSILIIDKELGKRSEE